MLSNSCRYALRAVIYLAKRYPDRSNVGIKEISGDLELPLPFLAKILQLLAKHKILNSTKGPNGGFSLLKKPESITMIDIVKIIDGEGIFKNCIVHDGSCADVRHSKKICPIHNDYQSIRSSLITLFKNKNIADLVKTIKESENIFI